MLAITSAAHNMIMLGHEVRAHMHEDWQRRDASRRSTRGACMYDQHSSARKHAAVSDTSAISSSRGRPVHEFNHRSTGLTKDSPKDREVGQSNAPERPRASPYSDHLNLVRRQRSRSSNNLAAWIPRVLLCTVSPGHCILRNPKLSSSRSWSNIRTRTKSRWEAVIRTVGMPVNASGVF